MQFKYPEILFALFLLLIPIFIHLFQLRRFQKVDFTNVAFLRKAVVQTRKSSQLKKWLTLMMRLLALACLIMAFAQPYFPSKIALGTKKETVVYIDNSHSMQAKGPKGNLLDRALQELFEAGSATKNISWFSNDDERVNSSSSDFKNDILKIRYSSNQLTPSQVVLKANQMFTREKDVRKQLIYISDFQQTEAFPDIPQDLHLDLVQLKPSKLNNVSVDSVFITSKNASTLQIKVMVSKQGEENSEVPISLFNGHRLTAKTAVDLSSRTEAEVTLDLENQTEFNGKLEITEANVPFDNTLYFAINKPEKIKVLAINNADGAFLRRLFDEDRFEFVQQALSSLDYNQIPNQNFMVLNGLDNIPMPLITAVKSFSDDGGSILIIPGKDIDITSYNQLLQTLSLGSFSQKIPSEKKVTRISFSHPLFQGVFEKEVANFQYPTVQSYIAIKSAASPALFFEDGGPFLLQKNKNYLFSASLGADNSNFIQSPLVVPSIYNMGLQSLPATKLYYVIGKQNTFAVPIELGPDQILTLTDTITQFIPLQQTKSNHVLITTTDQPEKAGLYQVKQDNTTLETIAYNFSRDESRLVYQNATEWKGATVHPSVKNLFDSLAADSAIKSFWKWFVIFALIFLICEMLILKFLK